MEVKRELIELGECSVKFDCESNSSWSSEITLPSELCKVEESEMSSSSDV